MTQEEKQLLIKDLCARLPYGIKVHIKGEYHKHHKVEEIDISNECVRYFENLHLYEEKIDDCLPYLRPMSSMTDEESKEFSLLQMYFCVDGILYPISAINMVNWLNEHHFDYHGLIKKGLALEAPEGMYNTKTE